MLVVGCCLAGEAVQARAIASQGEEAEVWILYMKH
jgi:hypothetical protein